MVHNYVKNIMMKYSKIFLTKLVLQKKAHYQNANIYKTDKMILLRHITKKNRNPDVKINYSKYYQILNNNLECKL